MVLLHLSLGSATRFYKKALLPTFFQNFYLNHHLCTAEIGLSKNGA